MFSYSIFTFEFGYYCEFDEKVHLPESSQVKLIEDRFGKIQKTILKFSQNETISKVQPMHKVTIGCVIVIITTGTFLEYSFLIVL